MPPKRKGDDLTGGTGDVNPQYMTIPFVAIQGTAGATPVSAVVPIPRYPEKNGRSIVMEVLAVEFVYDAAPGGPTAANTASGQTTFCVSLTTNPNALTSIKSYIQDPRVIQYDLWYFIVLHLTNGFPGTHHLGIGLWTTQVHQASKLKTTL